MKKSYIGLFDVIGPVMVGPSSSHTSGANYIAWMARQIFTGTLTRVDFTLYGSFADTYRGHGTDRALIGGILGYRSNDKRSRNAYQHAKEAGIKVNFKVDGSTAVEHPNTVDVVMQTEDGHNLLVRGESLGGGRARITRLNDIRVDFNGESSTLIIEQKDEPGVIAFITNTFAKRKMNIAFMKVFRKEDGDRAYTVIESDDFLPEELRDELTGYDAIISVEMIEL